MKLIKSFKLFENTGTIKYSFTFPILKRYDMYESYYEFSDVIDYLKSNGIKLKDDAASALDIHIDDITNDDIDEYVNNYKNYTHSKSNDNSWDMFKKDHALSYEEHDISSSDYRNLQEDFNGSNLKQYFRNDNFNLLSLSITTPKERDTYYSKIEGEFEVDRDLNDDELLSIKDYITGQCSDGWGEGYEQQERREDIQGLRFVTTISPWFFSKTKKWDVTITKN